MHTYKYYLVPSSSLTSRSLTHQYTHSRARTHTHTHTHAHNHHQLDTFTLTLSYPYQFSNHPLIQTPMILNIASPSLT